MTQSMVAREHILLQVRSRLGPNRRIVIMEAQAGQGKTIFADQLVSALDTDAVWYRIGPKDSDPHHFLTHFYEEIRYAFPDFRFAFVDRYAGESDKSADMTLQILDRLWQAFSDRVQSHCCLVLDDLHRFQNRELLTNVLAHAAGATNANLYVILISRHNLFENLPKRPPWASQVAVRMDNEMLKFSMEETRQLMTLMVDESLPMSLIEKVHRQTLGWPMGITTLCQNLTAVHNGDATAELSGVEQFSEYFCGILGKLPDEARLTLLKLGLLEELPMALVREIFPDENSPRIIMDLHEKNLFVHRVNRRYHVYGFQPIFHEALREEALTVLPADSIRSVYLRTAEWYASQGNMLSAIRYGLLGGDLAVVNQWLGRYLKEFDPQYETRQLHRLLGGIPRSDLQDLAWLCFWEAAYGNEDDTAERIRLGQRALAMFKKEGESLGHMLCLVHLIGVHIYMDVRLDLLPSLLETCQSLFDKCREPMPAPLKARVANALALGYAYYSECLDLAHHYAQIATETHIPEDASDIEVAVRLTRAHLCAVRGNWNGYGSELDGVYQLAGRHPLSKTHRQVVESMTLDYLVVSGQHQAFWPVWADFERSFGSDHFTDVLSQTYGRLRLIDVHLAAGGYDEALRQIQILREFPVQEKSPHLGSLVWAYRALLAGIRQENLSRIEAFVTRALRLRSAAGGFAFTVMTRCLVGCAYAYAGSKEKALHHLNSAIEGSERIGEWYLRTGALLHLAYLYEVLGLASKASESLELCLAGLAENQYTHFFCLTPMALKPLLKRAARSGIYPEYCNRLLRRNFNLTLTDDGRMIPLLEVEILSGMHLRLKTGSCERRMPVTNHFQAHLLALLVAAPGHAIMTGLAESTLWPDKNSVSARRNLDTTISRIRKQMAEHFQLNNPADYLFLGKGIIALRHLRVDVFQIRSLLERAAEEMAGECTWLAGLFFEQAWPCFNNVSTIKRLLLGDDLLAPLIETCAKQLLVLVTALGPVYLQSGKASRVTDRVLRVLPLAPLDLSLHALLYRAFQAQGQTRNAQEALDEYHRKLLQHDYTPSDAQRLVDQIW